LNRTNHSVRAGEAFKGKTCPKLNQVECPSDNAAAG
jgi:hypothetical protein